METIYHFYSHFSYVGMALLTAVVFLVIAVAMEKHDRMRPNPAVEAYTELLRGHDEFGGPADFSNPMELGLFTVVAGAMWPIFHIVFTIFAVFVVSMVVSHLISRVARLSDA